MKWTCGLGIFLIVVLCDAARSQDPAQGLSDFGDLSAQRLQMIRESRQSAQRELSTRGSAFDSQGIYDTLRFHSYLIAIARITAVQPLNDAAAPTRVTFHVEQFLRGQSDVAEFDVESRWSRKLSTDQQGSFFHADMNNRETALDKAEPKVGDEYMLGYTLDYGHKEFVFVLGVVDLEDPAQRELIRNIRRFLAMETEAGLYDSATYLDALEDGVPWIRDIAMHRLTESDECNGSPTCAQKFLAVVRRELQSDGPKERQQAVGWLVWIGSMANQGRRREGYERGLPMLPDSTLRVLFDAAVDDRNVVIGDEAFQYREDFEVHRSGSPGECFVIVPELRRSARVRGPLAPGFPLGYSYGCIPSH